MSHIACPQEIRPNSWFWPALQITATHCNTPTLCSTLHCNTMHHNVFEGTIISPWQFTVPLVGGDPHTSDWVDDAQRRCGGGGAGRGAGGQKGLKSVGGKGAQDGEGCDEMEIVLADGELPDGERDWGYLTASRLAREWVVCCSVLPSVAVCCGSACVHTHRGGGVDCLHTRAGVGLAHTTTHWNIPRHTATHCNTLKRTPTHWNTLQHTAGCLALLQPLYLYVHTRICTCVCGYEDVWVERREIAHTSQNLCIQIHLHTYMYVHTSTDIHKYVDSE